MANRSYLLTSFEAFLEEVFPAHEVGSTTARAAEVKERRIRLAAFPYEVVLQLAYPRWTSPYGGAGSDSGLPTESVCSIRRSTLLVTRGLGMLTKASG